jgi:hypothetical protein
MGLDIKEDGFHNNLKTLEERKGYFGKVNLRTGEKESYRLGQLIKFEKTNFLKHYFDFAKKILVLTEEDLKLKGEHKKTMSHTGTVTYHALKGEFGVHRTFVAWEPKQKDGKKGVDVKPEHCWMYFFDPRKVEQLKLDMNSSKS